ncbi:FAD-dependent oxidoreductase [Streptomyces sp. NPDC047928]|uniref:FAD-dependent oxidoreductase n=1 Tax=unclassified Streptomyces TaxID=2593676 RepID=UPI00371FD6A7
MTGAGAGAERTVDVLVVGAGPAGLAAAERLAVLGAGRVEVLEREPAAGGAPRHRHRTGPGPVDAPRRAEAAVRAGAALRTGVTATGWAGPLTLDTTGPGGLERITARAVVLATGARERPRTARLVPGTRPAGVLTAGGLQRAVHLYGQRIGGRAVVVGAGQVARHAVRTLRSAGTGVVALVAERPCHGPWPAAAGVPVLDRTMVTELLGRGRLSGVRVRHADGRTGVLACDTVVFTGDWIPDHELARYGGVVIDPGTRGPAVDAAFRTSQPGVFAVGNLLRGVESAGRAAAEGRAVAGPVLERLAGAAWPGARPVVTVGGPLRWVTPNLLDTGAGVGASGCGMPRWRGRGALLVRPVERLVRPVLVVRQDGRELYRSRVWRTAGPDRSVALPGPGAWAVPGAWAGGGVDPAGGPVRITVG